MLRVLLVLVPLALTVYALVDCIQTPADEVRNLPKIGWIVLIVLVWIAGPVAWLLAGRSRPDGSGRGFSWPPGAPGSTADRPGPQPPRRVVAPDDDPEFLRQLGRRDVEPPEAEHRDMLEQWERDLRRREGDLRGEPDPDSPLGDDGPDGPTRG